MTRTSTTALSITSALALATAAFASPGHQAGDVTAFGQPGDVKKISRTVRIEATEIKYNLSELTFKVGETVKFVFVNKGEQDHELSLGDSATQLKHRKMMQDMAAMPGMDMSKMPGHEGMDDTMLMTKPGETKELVWQFTKAGTVEFACNYPGHAEVGMAGKIVVR